MRTIKPCIIVHMTNTHVPCVRSSFTGRTFCPAILPQTQREMCPKILTWTLAVAAKGNNPHVSTRALVSSRTGLRGGVLGGGWPQTGVGDRLTCTMFQYIYIFKVSEPGNFKNLNHLGEKRRNLSSRRWYPCQPQGLEFDSCILSSVETPW